MAVWLLDKLQGQFYSVRHGIMKGHNSPGMNRKSVQAEQMLGHFSKSGVRCKRQDRIQMTRAFFWSEAMAG